MTKQEFIHCSLCGAIVKDSESHNAEPVCSGRCCSKCNTERVLPERFAAMLIGERKTEPSSAKNDLNVTFTDGSEPTAMIAMAIHKNGSANSIIRGPSIACGALLADIIYQFMCDASCGNTLVETAIVTAFERKERKIHEQA